MKTRSQSRKVSKLQRQHKINRGDARRLADVSYTATKAKNEFGRVLEQAIHGTTVFITKHDSPRAVLISIDQFQALERVPQLKLNTLSEQFDALLDHMQTPAARRGMAAAFNASSKRLGKAAVASARKRA